MARISIGNFDFIINSGGGGSADLTDLKNRVTSLESQLSNLPLQIVGESTQVGSSTLDLNLNTNGTVTINDDKVVATTDQIEAWATVGNDEVIPSSKLPSFVDDVVEVAELPETGEAGKIYVVTSGEDVNKQYRWSGSEFVQITSGGVVIGSVTGTAYDGGKGTVLEGRVTTVENNFANYPTKDELDIAISGATKDLVTQTDLEEATSDLATKDEIKNYGDGTVGDGFQLGLADKRMNLNSNGTVMVNSVGEVVVATPYPGEEGRKVIQLANHDSLSGVGTDGSTGGNLAMISKWDVADFGSKNFHTNLNVKPDNGHDGRITVNDDNEVAYLTDIPEVIEFVGLTDLETGASSASIQKAIGLEFADLVDTIGHNKAIFMDRNAVGDYWNCIRATGNISSGNGGANLMFMVGTVPTIYEVQYVNNEWALYVAKYEFAEKSDIPSLDGYATTQNLSDSIAAEASAREKAIETATSDLVHNTLTVAGKSLTGNITLASSDLTDGTSLAQKSEIPTDYVPNTRTVAGKALNADVTLYAADIKEKDNSADTVYDLMPKIVSCPIDARVVKDSYTVAEIFNMFGGATTMTEVRVFADRGVNYLRMANSIGSYQNYMIPVNYYQIPNGEVTTGTITLIGIGPDPHNRDLITKFTITMTLNGDASTIEVSTKALEV